MKTILGAALGALLLSGSAMAATPDQVTATYQVSASVPASVNQGPAVRDSTMALVNRTGSGR